MTVLRILDAAEAIRTVLRRTPWEDQEMPPQVLDGIERIFGERLTPAEAVARILADVRLRGDAALRAWSERIDGASLHRLSIPQGELEAAYFGLAPAQRAALDLAAERIAAFHRKQPIGSWIDAGPDGVMGQLIRPLDSVRGLRARRHRAAALVAAHGRHPGARGGRGPGDLLHAAGRRRPGPRSDPGRGLSGRRRSALRPGRRAGHRAHGLRHRDRARGGQDRRRGRPVRHAGQAPGDRQRGHRRLLRPDRDAGDRRRHRRTRPGPPPTCWRRPSTTCWPRRSCSRRSALAGRGGGRAAGGATGRTEPGRDRRRVAGGTRRHRRHRAIWPRRSSWRTRTRRSTCACWWRDPWALVGQIRNAGGIFVGEYSFEVLGDYVAGPSHVMPTEGSARYASPLSVADFVKRISLMALSAEAGARLAGPAAVLARGEGLTAHAAAAELRRADGPD